MAHLTDIPVEDGVISGGKIDTETETGTGTETGTANLRRMGEDARSFTSALTHVLSQPPDGILVGELHSLETFSVVRTSAETGKVVGSVRWKRHENTHRGKAGRRAGAAERAGVGAPGQLDVRPVCVGQRRCLIERERSSEWLCKEPPA